MPRPGLRNALIHNKTMSCFHKIVPYCYGPGLHEPGLNTSLTINKTVYNTMSDELKNIIKLCCYSEIAESLADFNYRNSILYKDLSEKYNAFLKITKFLSSIYLLIEITLSKRSPILLLSFIILQVFLI